MVAAVVIAEDNMIAHGDVGAVGEGERLGGAAVYCTVGKAQGRGADGGETAIGVDRLVADKRDVGAEGDGVGFAGTGDVVSVDTAKGADGVVVVGEDSRGIIKACYGAY